MGNLTLIDEKDYNPKKYPYVIAGDLIINSAMPVLPAYTPVYSYNIPLAFVDIHSLHSQDILFNFNLFAVPSAWNRIPEHMSGVKRSFFSFTNYKNKITVRMDGWIADLDIPDGKAALLSQTPTTFNLVNFRRIEDRMQLHYRDTLIIGNTITDNSIKAQITLSADEVGNLKMSLYEYYYV